MPAQTAPTVADTPAGLAIFVKTPGLSPVKSRLWPALGQPVAERLYRRMAAAVGASARPIAHRELTCYWAIAEDHPAARRCWRRLPTLRQGDGELGARMYAVQQALQTRHRSWLLTGADAVLLDARTHLRPALDWLDHPAPRVIFGPAEDGGFWLIGGNVTLSLDVWSMPTYSTDQTLIQIRAAIRSRYPSVEIGSLDAASDLDTEADLSRVIEQMACRPALARPQRRLLRRLIVLSARIRSHDARPSGG
jgi:glycosyltransferase A (GT-A) superfamily protein (DUF2064 family)